MTPHDERRAVAGERKLTPDEAAIVDSGVAFKYDSEGRIVSLGGNRAERRAAVKEQRWSVRRGA